MNSAVMTGKRKTKMHILFIAHNFHPEPNFFFGLPFAKALKKQGHTVEILTGLPNYPAGKIYDGYKMKLRQREMMDDIPVIRVPLYPSHNRSSIKRIISYSSLSLAQATLGIASVKKADVAYVCQGPATIGLPSIMAKWLRKIPFVYHIQDLWPDSLSATGMFDSKSGMKALHKWCKFVYSQANQIITISPGMKELLCERGVPESKIDIVYNWCDEQKFLPSGDISKPSLEYADIFKDKFNIVYAGNIGKAQALEAVIIAAEIILEKNSEIQFILIGDGIDKKTLQQKIIHEKIKNVKFIPQQCSSEINKFLNLADVLLVHLKDTELFKITIPSKIQAYLATGKPIMVGVNGDAGDLVLKAEAGFACQPENAESIAETALEFHSIQTSELEDMGTRGREFYKNNLTFEIALKQMNDIFEKAVK